MSGTEYPGPGDEWQARIKAMKEAEATGAIDRAAKLQGMAARIASRKLREGAAAKAFRNWPTVRTR